MRQKQMLLHTIILVVYDTNLCLIDRRVAKIYDTL